MKKESKSKAIKKIIGRLKSKAPKVEIPKTVYKRKKKHKDLEIMLRNVTILIKHAHKDF